MLLLPLFLLLTASLTAQSDDPTRFEEEVVAFERADAQDPPPSRPILFAGSSSVRPWESLPEDFLDQPVLSRGFGGSSFADLIH